MNSFSQVSEFAIKKPGKSKILSTDEVMDFKIDIAGDSLDWGSIRDTGIIESISKKGIELYPTSIEKEGSSDGNSFDYRQHFSDNPGDLIEIDPMTISSIYYQSRGASVVSSTSAILAIAGYTTALIIAPLISIEYRNDWAFNSERYYKLAGAGLITVGVTLPLAILTSGKTFEFKDLFLNDENDDGWEFDYDYVEDY